MQVKKQQLDLNMEQWPGSKLGKGYVKAVYCHPAYLTYMQSTSCEMLDWWNTNWNQECWEKYKQPQICRWHHPNGRKQRGTKEPLDKMKGDSEKAGLKLNIQKRRSGPITSWQIDGNMWKQCQISFSWAPKSMWMVTAATKLKDTCSLEGNLWQT